MGSAAITGIALGQTNRQPAAQNIIHDLIEQFRGLLARRLRE
jgi:hypothetical protein